MCEAREAWRVWAAWNVGPVKIEQPIATEVSSPALGQSGWPERLSLATMQIATVASSRARRVWPRWCVAGRVPLAGGVHTALGRWPTLATIGLHRHTSRLSVLGERGRAATCHMAKRA